MVDPQKVRLEPFSNGLPMPVWPKINATFG